MRFIEGYHDRLQQACADSGLSKTEIARRCGFERKVLYAEGMMDSFNLARFCAVTRISADWLLGLRRKNNG